LIGIAFDYVARAIVAQKIAKKEYIRMEKKLIAEWGLERFAELSKIKESVVFTTKDPVVNEERIKGHKVIYKNSKKILSYLEEKLESSIRIREQFIDGEENLSELILASIFLARLDFSFRNRSMIIADEYFRKNNEPTYFSQNVTISDTVIVENIHEMTLVFQEVIEEEYWLSTILNPSFGYLGASIGGADADFIVDEILVDMKTTDKLKYNGNDLAQLFGYAALGRAMGADINKVAIYFARFGCFVAIDLDDRIVGGDKFLSKFLGIIQTAAE